MIRNMKHNIATAAFQTLRANLARGVNPIQNDEVRKKFRISKFRKVLDTE